MLTVSLHGIYIHAPIGAYKEEHILGNEFEIDVDVLVNIADGEPLPFVDYTLIRQTVEEIMNWQGRLLEDFVQEIHSRLKEQFPIAEKVSVTIRKLHPPMSGKTKYAQVRYEA